jgi:ABC-type nitrate/sulfonate/bicarbonate transport system permease component
VSRATTPDGVDGQTAGGSRREAWTGRPAAVAGVALALVAWEAAGRLTGGSLPPATAVFSALVSLYVSGELIGPLVGGLGRLGAGYLAALAVGIPLGVATGVSDVADATLGTYVTVLFVTSVSSLLPFLILLVGTGAGFHATVVFLFAVFHVVLTVRDGAGAVDPGLVEAGRVFGADGVDLARHVLLPASLPFLLAALRVGFVRAVKGLVVAELWIYAGFGSLLHSFQQFGQTDRLFAVLVQLMCLSVMGVTVLRRLERRYADWWGTES